MSRIFFNGVDLKATYNFVVQSINDPFNIEIPSVAIQGRDGEIYFEDLSRLDKRTITLTGKIYGNSHADVMSKILGLKNLIATAHNRGKLEVEYNDGSGTKTKYMYVQLAGEIWNTQPIGARAGFAAANLTIRFSAIDKPFWIVETSNNNIVVAPLTNLKYGGTWWKDLGWELEPYTIVNLLGKYGDFETEGETPGIADGWTPKFLTSQLLDTGLFGNYAQKFSYDNTGGSVPNNSRIESIYIPASETHKYFMLAYCKNTNINDNPNQMPWIAINDYDSENVYLNHYTGIFAPQRTTSWQLIYSSHIPTLGTAYLSIHLRQTVDVGYIDEVWWDGAMLVDLTAMGALPYGLQQYFGLQKWEDLATDSNIEALDGRVQSGEDWLAELLPYVNSVASVGFAWESDV